MKSLLAVGTSKKQAKHNAAESLLSLVEGTEVEPAADKVQYVVGCLLQSVD